MVNWDFKYVDRRHRDGYHQTQISTSVAPASREFRRRSYWPRGLGWLIFMALCLIGIVLVFVWGPEGLGL